MKNVIGMALLGLTSMLWAQPQEKTVFTLGKDIAPQKTPEYFLGAGTELVYSINSKKAVLNTPERLAILKDLKLQTLRGPAGTISNWYLWKKVICLLRPNRIMQNITAKNTTKEKAPGNVGSVAELYDEAGKLAIPYVFNVNVETQSPEDIADLVKDIKKLSGKPIFLEMGNELFEPGDCKAFPTCQEYVTKVRAINQAVKAVDPAVKIGVVCPSYPFSEEKMIGSALRKLANTNNKPIDRYLEWDDILAANQDAFDAVILHPYIFYRVENATPESIMAFMAAWNAAGKKCCGAITLKCFRPKKSG